MRDESQSKVITASQQIEKQSTIDVVIREIHELQQSIKKHREELKRKNML